MNISKRLLPLQVLESDNPAVGFSNSGSRSILPNGAKHINRIAWLEMDCRGFKVPSGPVPHAMIPYLKYECKRAW